MAHGEWWRLITSAFLHYGPIHLGLNMLALYWGGRVLEHVIGSWRYLLLYLAAGVAGSAGALWLSPNEATVGASGAIFGIFGALLVLERRGTIQSGGQILALIVLNLVISVSLQIARGRLDSLVARIILFCCTPSSPVGGALCRCGRGRRRRLGDRGLRGDLTRGRSLSGQPPAAT